MCCRYPPHQQKTKRNCRECLKREWIAPIVTGIEQLTGIGMQHAEDISLTRYAKGGFYGKHHDYVLERLNPRGWAHCGNRILTFLLYLNEVKEGGGTSFFHLGIEVKPKPGRALLFPNVLSDKPFSKDERTVRHHPAGM